MRERRFRRNVEELGSGKVASSEPVPASMTEVSGSRTRVPDLLSTGWMDRLLVAVVDLPLSRGERPVVEAVVDAVADILPAYAIGARIVVEGAGVDRLLVRKAPGGIADAGVVDGAARLFPGLAYEYTAAVPGHPGSTLHVASGDLELDADSSPAAHLIDRAALALGRALALSALAAQAKQAPASGDAAPTPSFQERMAQADKLATFGQIAAGVVHELNNPLTSIVAYSEYLIRRSQGAGSDAGDIDRLRRISEAANRMLRFTRDLVSYARPSTGPAQELVLHDAIDRAIAFCEHVLAASGVEVERRYCADVGRVVGVTEQLVQVFINLLTNACQAAPDGGGRVIVTTSLVSGGARPVMVVVEDNGGGIAPEHLPHVFAPFFTTKGDKHGTGLGLSIVKSIVEGHGGAVRAESATGHGARFVVELP
jgi:signal transduction histidine kinase